MDVFGEQINLIHEVIVALIGLAILYIFRKFGRPLVNLRVRFSKTYSNNLYKQAAKSNLHIVSIALLYLLLLFVVMISTIAILEIVDSENIPAPDKKISSFEAFIIGPYGEVIVITLIIALNLILMEFFGRQTYIYNLIVEYNQKLKLIRPKLEDKDFWVIEQMWASMKESVDYDKIQKRIEESIKRENL